MREILFRGKSDSNKWIYGDLMTVYDEENYRAIQAIEIETPRGIYRVDPETVCQYTGLTDKNGKKIFEGDIVQEQDDKCVGIVRYGVYDSSFNSDGLGGHMGFYIEWKEGRIKLRRIDIVFWSDVIEVIGNIFDNPELMETDYE